MRDTVWNLLYFYQFNFFYYGRWRHILERRNSRLKFGSALVTMVAIACWSHWHTLSVLWTALISLTQVLSLYAEYAGLSEKVMRLRYWGEDAQKTINKITALWDEVNDISDSEIRDRLQILRDEWSTLDARFLHGINPYNDEVLKLADKEVHEFIENILLANHGPKDKSREEITK